MSSDPLLLCSLAGVFLFVYVLPLFFGQRAKRAPGPIGVPILGNIFQVLGPDLWETARRWEKKHGGIIHLNIIRRPIVIINSYDIAVELLEKRGSIYSSRSELPMTTDFQKWSWMTPTVPYGDLLKEQRQIFHRFFQQKVVSKYHPLLVSEANKLLLNLLETPERFFDHVRRESGAVIMMIAYGHEVKDEDDHFISLAEEGLKVFGESALPFLVNFIPSLIHLPDWFPGTEFKRIARRGYKLSQDMLNVPFQTTKRLAARGLACQSMTTELLENSKDGQAVNDDLIASTTATVYAAGSDTTVSAILTFILAMVTNLQAQRRAQEELDRVLGPNTLPTFEDKGRLPYIEAIIKECLRWQVVAPFAAPHSPIVDDVFDGNVIKAGTAVCPNTWAMLRDAKEYPNPDMFFPERWLPKNGRPMPRHPSKIAFGFGRRMCPGRFLAEDSIFITVASILTVFKIERETDNKEFPVIPDRSYQTSLLRHPKPFKCKFVPRSHESASLLKEICKD